MTLSTAANRTFAFVPALLSVSVFVLSAVCPDAAWAGTSTGGQEHFADGSAVEIHLIAKFLHHLDVEGLEYRHAR